MKILPLLLSLAALTTATALAQTQSEMNQEASADFKKADAKLNAVYQKVKAAQDEDGLPLLKTAQRAWLAYRDAEATLEAAPNKGGTIYPLVYAETLTRLTEERTKELKVLLLGPEGEAAEADVPRDANGNAYGKDDNPEGMDDPNQ